MKDPDNTGGFLIDYIQLLQTASTNKNTRQEELKEICFKLQRVSQSLNCVLVLACQFNRQGNNALKLHANYISEAGDIERNASLILGLCDLNRKMIRDKGDTKELLYNIFKHLDSEAVEPTLKPYLYIEILKNRNGNPNLKSLLLKDNNIGKLDKFFNKAVVNGDDETTQQTAKVSKQPTQFFN